MRTLATALDSICAVNERFCAAAARGDAAGMASCYAPDGLLLPPGLPVLAGREAIEAFWSAGIASGLRSVELDTLELELLADDAAVERGRATVVLAPDDGPRVVDVGKYVVLHRRDPAASWAWAVDIFNSDVEAPVAR